MDPANDAEMIESRWCAFENRTAVKEVPALLAHTLDNHSCAGESQVDLLMAVGTAVFGPDHTANARMVESVFGRGDLTDKEEPYDELACGAALDLPQQFRLAGRRPRH